MRRDIVMRMLDVMKTTVKSDADPSWSLVIPPFRQMNTEVYEPWEDFFDTSPMNNLAKDTGFKAVLETNEFFRIKKVLEAGVSTMPRIDLAILTGSQCPNGIEDARDINHKLFGVKGLISQE